MKKNYILLSFFLLFVSFVFGQDYRVEFKAHLDTLNCAKYVSSGREFVRCFDDPTRSNFIRNFKFRLRSQYFGTGATFLKSHEQTRLLYDKNGSIIADEEIDVIHGPLIVSGLITVCSSGCNSFDSGTFYDKVFFEKVANSQKQPCRLIRQNAHGRPFQNGPVEIGLESDSYPWNIFNIGPIMSSLYYIPKNEEITDLRNDGNEGSIVGMKSAIAGAFGVLSTMSGNPLGGVEVKLEGEADSEYRLGLPGYSLESLGFTEDQVLNRNLIVRGVACGCHNQKEANNSPEPVTIDGYWPQEERVVTSSIIMDYVPLSPQLTSQPSIINTSCIAINDGKIELSFDKDLASGFKLLYNLRRFVDPRDDIPMDLESSITIPSSGRFDSFEPGNKVTITGVESGTYFLVYQTLRASEPDNLDYGEVKSVEVTQKFEVKAPTPITFTTNKTNAVCTGGTGSITITASGGKDGDFPLSDGIYEFSRDGGSTWTRPNPTTSNTHTFTNVAPRTTAYPIAVRLTKTGISNCNGSPATTNDGSVSIQVPSNPLSLLSILATKNQSYRNAGDAEITVNINNGNPSPNFTYSLEEITSGSTITRISTNRSLTFTNLTAGTYNVNVSDGTCTVSNAVADNVAIINPAAITYERVSIDQDIDCFEEATASASIVNVQGGTSTFYRYQVFDTDGDEVYLGSANAFSNLSKGSYTFRIANSPALLSTLGAFASGSFEIGAGITQVTIRNVTPNNAVCFGDAASIAVNVTGGSAPYSYRLGTTGNYTPLATTGVIAIRSNFTGVVYVRDTNGCTKISSNVQVIVPREVLEVVYESQANNVVFGEAEGSFKVSVFGGHGGYRYEWEKDGATYVPTSGTLTEQLVAGDIELTLDDLEAGVYNLTVSDSEGCEKSLASPISITEPAALQISEINEEETIPCFNETGELSVTTTGGIGPYRYEWRLGGNLLTDTDAVLENAVAGSYSVVVYDQYTSASPVSVKVLNAPTALSVTTSPKAAACFGEATGSVQINVSGGTPPYRYSLDNVTYNSLSSLSDNTLEALKADTYELYIQDANNCSLPSIANFKITEPAAIQITPVINQEIRVRGAATGVLEVSASGGSGTLSYNWTKEDDLLFSATTARIENITAGKYTVSVSDVNGCSEPASFEVLEPEALEVDLKELLAIKCFGEATGALEATVRGGYPIVSTITDFNLTWFKIEAGVEQLVQEGQGLATLNRQPAGEYKVVVTDSEGTMASDTFRLISPTKFEVGLKETGNEQCFEAKDGFIDINVSGGTPPYSYEWTKVADASYSSATQNIADLSAGIYKLTAKDANDCAVDLTEVIDLESPEIVFTSSVSEITGSGLSNGRIRITATGGTGPLSYQWSKVGDASFAQTTASISDLSEGTYVLEIKDAKGCTEEFSRELLAPDTLQVTLNEAQANACFGATTSDIIATVSGGVPQSSTAPLYDYQWYKIVGTTETELIGEKEAQLINQASGSYRLVVTDKNGNTNQDDITTIQPDEIKVSLAGHQDEQCYQANDGFLEVSVTGGVQDASGNYLAYTYEWRKRGDARFSGNTARIENLSPGIYRLAVVDQALCSPLMESEYEIKGVEERLLIDAPVVSNLTGFNTQNGSVAITVTGGTAPYSYVWSSDQASFTTIDNSKIANLSSGKYQVVVSDANGCSVTSIEISVSEPNQLGVNIPELTAMQGIPCFGEMTIAPLTSSVTGGVPPYSYEWTAIANGQSISTNETAPPQAQGEYRLEVTDANGNTASTSRIITEPLVLEITNESSTPVSCFNGADGEASVSITGGTPPYSYLWNTNAITPSITALKSGIYNVRITDARGCSIETALMVSEPSVLRSEGITVRTFPSAPGVNDGMISVTIIGGTPPYDYVWQSLVDGTIISTPSSNAQAVLNNTNAFGYGLTVTDANDCELVIDDVDNIVIAPINIDLSIEKAVSCQGTATGSIQARVSGGIPFSDIDEPYTYEWYDASNNTIVASTPKRLEAIGAGSYYVVVTDAQGTQQQSDVLAVTEPTVLEIASLEESFISCGIGADWQINTMVVGGALPYTYQWSTGASTANVEELLPGVYSLTVTDALGCKAERSITLTPPPALVITEQISNPICFDACTGSIEVTTTGGIAPYTYNWNTGAITATVQNLCAGVYELIVTDALGCEEIHTYEIVNPEAFTIDLGEDITLCKDQTAELDASIPNGVSYRWSSSNGFLSEQAQVEITATGLYEVIVINADNCEARDEIFVELTNDEISAGFIASSQVFVGEPFIIVNIANPKPDLMSWNFPQEAIVDVVDNDFIELTFDNPGTYDITFDVARGLCKASITKQVVVLERDTSVADQPITAGGDVVVSKFVNYNLYPNPILDGIFTLDIKMSEPAKASISVYELTSHSIIANRVLEKKDRHEELFELQTSASGIYLVVVESELGNQVLKLVVE